MEKRSFKDKVYLLLSNMIKAMANPHRLEIIDLLGQGEKTVEEIASESTISVANASQHLQVLKANNLVAIRRQGNFIYYRLAHAEVYRCWQTMRQLGIGQIAEIEKVVKDFREQHNSLEAVGLDELKTRIRSRHLVILDVRPSREYEDGHIPGAINIPMEDLSRKMKSLAKNKDYVAYCRGPFCVFADDAVQALTKKGFRVKRLEGGYPDWKMKFSEVEVA
jgi:rhodanese-related sulfurtransferase